MPFVAQLTDTRTPQARYEKLPDGRIKVGLYNPGAQSPHGVYYWTPSEAGAIVAMFESMVRGGSK